MYTYKLGSLKLYSNLKSYIVTKKQQFEVLNMSQILCKWQKERTMWHMVGGEHSFKMSAPQLLRLGIDSVLKIF